MAMRGFDGSAVCPFFMLAVVYGGWSRQCAKGASQIGPDGRTGHKISPSLAFCGLELNETEFHIRYGGVFYRLIVLVILLLWITNVDVVITIHISFA